MSRRKAPKKAHPPVEPVARPQAIIGFALGIGAAMLAVVWQIAIPLALIAMATCWLAAQRARGRDGRSIGFAVGGMAAAGAAILLALASLLFGGDPSPDDRSSVVDGIESSTTDAEHPPQKDLEPGTQCTVDLAGLRADGVIVNRTDEPWRYSVRVVWENEAEQLAESDFLLDTVDPGARAPFRAVSPKTGTAATTCRVATINRLEP